MSTERPDGARPVDDAVDQAWRTASHEEPGPRLDATILAAARAEAEKAARQSPGRRRQWWTNWQPLAAAATVAGLAFVLVQTIPRDRDVAPPIAVERASPETTERDSAAESAAGEARDARAAPPSAESRRVMEPQARFTATPPPPATPTTSPSAEASATAPVAPPEETDADAAGSAEATAAPPSRNRSSAPVPATAPAPAGIAAQAERGLGASQREMKSAEDSLTPGAWAARIAELFDSGDRAAAAEELRAFRSAHADADRYLPEDLHEWAAAVQ